MPWQTEAEAVLALTRAAREALGRGDVETLGLLLEERGVRVHRLGAAAGPAPCEPELVAAVERIKTEESALAAALRVGLFETGQALGRLASTPSATTANTIATCDMRA
jgi:hypothetical protein